MRQILLNVLLLFTIIVGCGDFESHPMYDPNTPGSSANFNDGSGGVSANWLNAVPATYDNMADFLSAAQENQVGQLVSLRGYGEFIESASLSTTTIDVDDWSVDGRFVFVKDGSNGVVVVNLQTMAVEGTLTVTGDVVAVHTDGVHLAVGSDNAGSLSLTVFDVSGEYADFSELYSVSVSVPSAILGVRVAGDYVYTIGDVSSSLEQRDITDGSVIGAKTATKFVAVSGEYIAYGTTLTDFVLERHTAFNTASPIKTESLGSDQVRALYLGPRFIWVADNNTKLHRAQINDQTGLTLASTLPFDVTDLWSDGAVVYAKYTDGSSIQYLVALDALSMTELQTLDLGPSALDFMTDGFDIIAYGGGLVRRMRGWQRSRSFVVAPPDSIYRTWNVLADPL